MNWDKKSHRIATGITAFLFVIITQFVLLKHFPKESLNSYGQQLQAMPAHMSIIIAVIVGVGIYIVLSLISYLLSASEKDGGESD